MKQKQVKGAPKNAKQTNAQKAVSPKKLVAAAAVEEVEEEPVEEEVVAAKKLPNKKVAKDQKKIVDEEEEEDDEVEEDEGDDDEEPIDQEEGDEDDEDQEDEEDHEEDEDDDDENDDENDDDEDDDEDDDYDDDEDDDDDDEEYTIPSKVKSGEIPPCVEFKKIIHIKKLPPKCKQIDIIKVFAKYGPIDYLHMITTPTGTIANLAFRTGRAAYKATIATNKKVTVNDSVIEVAIKKPRKERKPGETKDKFNILESRERTVYVKYLKRNTTEDQIREHFAACGEVERCKAIVKNSITFAFVTFTDKKAVPAARKLHNSVLNEATIGVYENNPEAYAKVQRDPKLTIMLKNKQQLQNLEGEKLEKVFVECGEIDNMDVLCKKNILAFITFKNEEAVKKAYELNGKTEQGVELVIEEFNPEKKKTSIYVSNLPRDCTDEELRNLFSQAGEIKNVILKKGFAIIFFKDSDAYCKSFLLNESYIRNHMIFMEPHSQRKQSVMKTKMSKLFITNQGRKRTTQNGNSSSVFIAKKPKTQKVE